MAGVVKIADTKLLRHLDQRQVAQDQKKIIGITRVLGHVAGSG